MLGKYGVNNLLMATNFLALTHCLVHSLQCPSITCGDEFCLSTTRVMQGTLIERCPHVNEQVTVEFFVLRTSFVQVQSSTIYCAVWAFLLPASLLEETLGF